MKIFYQNKESFDIFNFSEKNKNLQKFRKNISIDKLFKEWKELNKSSIFLLDENFFSFFVFDIYENFENRITIKNLKDIVEKKKIWILSNYENSWTLLYYYIEDINVDGDFFDYVIGKKGKVFFRLKMVFLKKEIDTLASICSGNNCFEKFSFYPQSIFTANFLKNKLKKKDISILYINEEFTKLVNFQKWFYHFVDEINFGLSSLKDVFKEKNILDFYYKSFSYEDINQFTENLIRDSLDFFSGLLVSWLKDLIPEGGKVFVLSKILDNEFFLEEFGKKYCESVWGFVLPFKTSDELKDFGRKWNYEEIDILTALNNLQIFAKI